MSGTAALPGVDFGRFDQSRQQQREIAAAVDAALSQVGFMAVRNLGISDEMLRAVFEASRAFFSNPLVDKQRCGYQSARDIFGYQGIAQENLDPTAPADLKETFTMRNLLHRDPTGTDWPSEDFRRLMTTFYETCLSASCKIMQALALARNTQENFFKRCHSGENVTLRLLHYPSFDGRRVAARQLGAGAHSDYGLLTLLFQDGVGGLEVQRDRGDWAAVAATRGEIVINSGDLLEVWTNGRYRSTVHRVQPILGTDSRQSIAVFVDPDSATQVTVLPSRTSADNPPRFSPTSAGEHLQRRIEASH